MNITSFIDKHFKHFNASSLKAAAQAYRVHIEKGGQMILALAGAMSTAEIGVSLAEMIREGKVHAISCTGANMEEDVFNLIANREYRQISNYRDLTPNDEYDLLQSGFSRVTDTCIPEESAMRRLSKIFLEELRLAGDAGTQCFPHELLYRIIRAKKLNEHFQTDPRSSWLVAAAEYDLPLFVPGWEDSTLGNYYAAWVVDGTASENMKTKSGIDYMVSLIHWYIDRSQTRKLGFFQIGGGIAGDFPICVVPLIQKDLGRKDVPIWSYFCQVTDSTTSYGSYSGAATNEKISWGKLGVETPRFSIESDATIVVPLVFGYVLGW